MALDAVTISIGRNIGAEPMPDRRWLMFREAVWEALDTADATVHVGDAKSIGEWEGIAEDSATFVAEVPPDNVPALLQDIRELCGPYGQDAIAVTVGRTFLVRP